MDFSISDEELSDEFKDHEIKPVTNTITIDSNHIHYVYVDRGLKNLAVFVHGSPGSWSAFIDFFKNDTLLADYDLLAIDRPGFGESDHGRPEPSLAQQAAQLKEVVALFPHDNKIMVGHSLGGPVIARIAMDYPKLCDGMVMVAPSIDPGQEKFEWYRPLMKSKIGGAVTPTDFWVSNEEIVALKLELEKMLPLWAQIEIPSIVIQGTKDVLVPKENAEFARNMLPDSLVEVRYLEGVNHFIPWSDPQTIVQALEDLKE